MIDLVSLVADKSMEAAIQGLLRRPQSLGICAIEFETVVHPEHDPGCFHHARKLLDGYVRKAAHALIVLDLAWEGAPARDGAALERALEASLTGYAEGWARAVVIEPELEAWVFTDSPHVPRLLGQEGPFAELRRTLAVEGLWGQDQAKPGDPKRAVEWLLYRAKQPRSSSTYRKLAETVSLQGCRDRSFLRTSRLLQDWFGTRVE